ncbi:MAG: PQQ-dependent sugar dehydrogenase [Chloroherpetonaceae bacterium]|nr:PQQ-dependent sugar dehydrogenase [Chloroherpetonaceae bacterium]
MKIHTIKLLFLISFTFFTRICVNGQVTLTEPFSSLTFGNPVDIQNCGDSRLFIVSQNGIIYIVDRNAPTLRKTFLDIRARITSGGELGLLGLAFHPNYTSNGFFYVFTTRGNSSNPTNQTNPLRIVVSRFSVTSNPDSADSNSELILFSTSKNQNNTNHNGGAIAFGKDGFLYFTIGDGGGSGDPQNNAQNLTNYHGKMMRIDVNQKDSGLEYAIPTSNPFASHPTNRKEIFAWGLRNVWRFSVDTTGEIWAGDVGQGQREEVNIIENGKNYGWRKYEGTLTYNTNDPVIPDAVFPLHSYSHENNNLSITGGYVYRGTQIPSLSGAYIFGDYGSGRIWSLRRNPSSSPTVTFLVQLSQSFSLSTFGFDNTGEMYVANVNNGRVFRLTGLLLSTPRSSNNLMFELEDNFPNPFNPTTQINYTLARAGEIELNVFDVLGRKVSTLVSARQEAGRYSVTFDARDQSSGIYFYQLRAGGFLQTKKMVLIK